MLKIHQRKRHKELMAVFALMLGISGGATIALNNQPGFDPPRGPGEVAGISDEKEPVDQAPVPADATGTQAKVQQSSWIQSEPISAPRTSSTRTDQPTQPATSVVVTESPSTAEPAVVPVEPSAPPVVVPPAPEPVDPGGGVIDDVLNVVDGIL